MLETQKVTLEKFLKITMANNDTKLKDIAEIRGKSAGSLSVTMKQKSMNLDTLASILKAMDEDVVLTLKNGQSYLIIFDEDGSN